MAKYGIWSNEKQGPTAKIAPPSQAIIYNQTADKEFPRQEKTKGVHLTKPLLYEMLKGLIQEKKDQNYEQ